VCGSAEPSPGPLRFRVGSAQGPCRRGIACYAAAPSRRNDMSKTRRPSPSDRRNFLKASVLVAGGMLLGPRSAAARARRVTGKRKRRIAGIGIGGKGESDLAAMQGEDVVALCDVDFSRGAKTLERFPDARRYHDYREMFERESSLDAVVVSTPDHSHAVPAL